MKNLFTLLSIVLFSGTVFAQSDMAFKAKIENRNGDVLYIKDQAGKIVQEIKLNPKGMFQAQFAVKDGIYQLFDGQEYAQLFLKNGYDLNMTMNAAQFDETIKFEGKGSKENNFLAQETLAEEKFEFDKVIALDAENFNKVISQKRTADIDKMKNAGLDPYFVQVHQADIERNLFGLQQYYTQVSANKKLNNTISPSFDYENHNGGKTKLEDLRGKYVYIDVWATWCGPCRAEIPSLKIVEDKYNGKNIAFVSISIDEMKNHSKWKSFVDEKKLEGIQLIADKNWNSDFLLAYKINSIPRFILIDPTGKIIDADAARPSEPRLQKQLDTLLQ
jgi:thiol-disulfide isomerase/thioredoxin